MIMQLNVYWIFIISKKLQINCCWFKQKKALDAGSRAIQQIIFTGKVDAAAVIYYIYEKSKETVLEFYKGKTKVL